MENLHNETGELKENSIEEQANSQENASILLFNRLLNNNIKNQLIDLSLKSEIWKEKNIINNVPIRKDNGDWLRDSNKEMVFNKIPYVAKKREDLEKEYEDNFKRIIDHTNINFTFDEPAAEDLNATGEIIPLNWMTPDNLGNKTSKQIFSITESHEKGHNIRNYDSEYFKSYFAPGFDYKIINFSYEEYLDFLKYKQYLNHGIDFIGKTLDFNDWKDEVLSYLSNGSEIAERMSQLKNYFGFKGDEKFTLEQLNYAKTHYVEDTKLDNHMTKYLLAITPETQDEFIRLINSSGI